MQDYREKIVSTYNSFNGKDLSALDSFYAEKVFFQDPAVTKRDLASLKSYYAHAYKNVKSISFKFDEISNSGEQYFAPWTMTIAAKGLNGGSAFDVTGLSHLKFNSKGLVSYHRDYLDLGELVYERLPVQGFIITQIKKMLG